ncbi:MAG: acyl--CoA ligase [Lachnospiraceae bacterium]|nr:acyl--CoA ligase [Lachnospiraceae bacterium]
MAGYVKTNQKCWQFIRALNVESDERLDSVALSDGKNEYTYRRMLRKWELYAEVFSALGICGSNNARAGMTGTPAAETIIAFYALNMTGTSVSMVHMSDLMDPARWERMVREESITDLILADNVINPDLLERIVRERSSIGIKRIIILQIPLTEEYVPDEEKLQMWIKRRWLREYKGVLFMDKLLKRYEAYDIEVGKKNDNAAVIAHTSGTTRGIHKPVPLSDKGLNEAALSMLSENRFKKLIGNAVSSLFMDMSSAYAFTDMVHLTLAFGGRLVLAPGVRYIEDIAAILENNKVNVLFATAAYMDAFMKLKRKPDLSALRFVFVGGSYVSANKKQRFNSFLKDCGSKAKVTLGYGLSETAGACMLSDPERDDDSMGKPLSGVRIKLYDEDEKKFYDLSDKARRGVLFISSPSVSGGRIGNKQFFSLKDTGDGKYLNTYDLVNAGEDGYLRYAGRMNRYFVNNEGIRFDAGLIETAMSGQPGIENCCITPGYDKSIHDTIPVLNVSVTDSEDDAERVIEEALVRVFIDEGMIKDTNLPGQCMIAKKLPLNAMGKVDAKRITDGQLKGRLYRINPERKDGLLKDVELVPFKDAPGLRAGLPDELEE